MSRSIFTGRFHPKGGRVLNEKGDVVITVTHAFQDHLRTIMAEELADMMNLAAFQNSHIGTEKVQLTKHCDNYIESSSAPACLRDFLNYARAPAHGALTGREKPKLFADYEGERVRVVMASRFGDVGITKNLTADHGYSKRVSVEELSEFSDSPPPQEF